MSSQSILERHLIELVLRVRRHALEAGPEPSGVRAQMALASITQTLERNLSNMGPLADRLAEQDEEITAYRRMVDAAVRDLRAGSETRQEAPTVREARIAAQQAWVEVGRRMAGEQGES